MTTSTVAIVVSAYALIAFIVGFIMLCIPKLSSRLITWVAIPLLVSSIIIFMIFFIAS